MPRQTEKSALIDGLLRLAAIGGLTAAVIFAPNAIQLFDKPLQKYFKKLDQHARERELRRTITYMKHYRLVTGDYEHGLQLTPKAKRRLKKLSFNEITITKPKYWDRKWRIVFFDIPETSKSSRDGFAAKARGLGFKVLQRSVFVHPFSCREEVVRIAEHFGVSRYVSYIETAHLDNETALVRRFKHLLK
jgi:DNA-binding transcriptional regulator PaaX